jgi:hypothetical protein
MFDSKNVKIVEGFLLIKVKNKNNGISIFFEICIFILLFIKQKLYLYFEKKLDLLFINF